MRKWFNQFTKATILYLDYDQLSLFLADGRQIHGGELADLPSLTEQPLILAINPMQFLQVQQQLRHLYLTSWQQEILRQLVASPCVLGSLLFLPDLIQISKHPEPTRLIHVANQNYLEICQDGVLFWTQLKEENPSQYLHEAGLYLRRYQINYKSEVRQEPFVPVIISTADLLIAALQASSFSLQVGEFPLIERLMRKQHRARRYGLRVIGLMVLIGSSVIAALFFLWLSVQTVFDYNPWRLVNAVKRLPAIERTQLVQFKEFLKFQLRSAPFSADSLKNLFQQFPGKIVATDMVWQKGEWTIAFIVNPASIAHIPEMKEWITQNLKNSKLLESESAIHQYTLQFN